MSSKSKQGSKAPPRAVLTIPLKVSTSMVREAALMATGKHWNEHECQTWLKREGGRMLRQSIEGFLPDAVKAAIGYCRNEATRRAIQESQDPNKIVVAKRAPTVLIHPDTGAPLTGREAQR